MSDVELYDGDDEDDEEPQEESLADLDERITKLRTEADELANADAGTSLVPVGSNVPAQTMKTAMAHRRAALKKKAIEVREAQEILRRRLDTERYKLEAALEPMMKQVARLQEGIWSVNLYLGRDEQIVTLAEGEPAPAETPISVRQTVLYMDEESLLKLDDGGIDGYEIRWFDEWLMADPANLDQVLPEERGVVVLKARRRSKDYENPWESMSKTDADKVSYWLIRNGGMLYRMNTDINVGARLIPAQDEFTSFFQKDRFGHAIEPGTKQWIDAEESAEARQRHFMRIALVLQGLVDRTAVFHPLPGPMVSFLEPESYDLGHVRVITDAERSLTTGREPYRDWIRRLNRQLRPGMRIIGAFGAYEVRDELRPDRDGYGGRVSPQHAALPAPEVLHEVEEPRQGGFVIRYRRSDKRYGWEFPEAWNKGDWGEWEYQKRASCVVYPEDTFIIPFDLVTTAELEDYLNARTERHHYLNLVPLLQAALDAKHAEAEREADFRKLLVGEIMKDGFPEIDETALDDLVHWYKLTNHRHRPLVDMDMTVKDKAVQMIVTEHRRRVTDETTKDDDREAGAVAWAKAEHGDDLLYVGRKRDGSFVMLVAARPNQDVFVHRITTSATGKRREVTEWMFPKSGWKRWRELYSTERWTGWNFAAAPHRFITDPEIEVLVEEILAGADRKLMAITYGDAGEGYVRDGFHMLSLKTRRVSDPKNPLTGKRPRIVVEECKIRWHREKGKAILSDRRWWQDSHHFRLEPRPGIGPSMAGREDPEAHDPFRDYGDTVWIDESELERARKLTEDLATVSHKISLIAAVANAAWRSIIEGWTEMAEKAAYDRFIEDYADPDLWEDHRKSIQINFPYGGTRIGHDGGEAIIHMINRLIETGQEIHGLTVAEAAKLAGHTAEIPEDLADIVISTKPEEVDEDEDY